MEAVCSSSSLCLEMNRGSPTRKSGVGWKRQWAGESREKNSLLQKELNIYELLAQSGHIYKMFQKT
jgi:hypothetical protein